MPNPHDPSLRVPSSRLPQTPVVEPPADAGGVLLPGAFVRAALHPLHFLINQLWLGAAPLADLLGLPQGAPQPDHPRSPASGVQPL